MTNVTFEITDQHVTRPGFDNERTRLSFFSQGEVISDRRRTVSHLRGLSPSVIYKVNENSTVR